MLGSADRKEFTSPSEANGNNVILYCKLSKMQFHYISEPFHTGSDPFHNGKRAWLMVTSGDIGLGLCDPVSPLVTVNHALFPKYATVYVSTLK